MVVKLWMKAAKLGHVGAQYKMGWCYIHGCRIPYSDKEAAYWFQKAESVGSIVLSPGYSVAAAVLKPAAAAIGAFVTTLVLDIFDN